MNFPSSWLLCLLLASCASGPSITSINLHDRSNTKLRAEVYTATPSPAPTVLILHGCGGVDEHHRDWARQIQAWGLNAVVIDSFRSRYVNSACERPMNVSPLQRAVDAHLSAKWITEQPWSTHKIGVIGFSHGAWSTLHAATKEDALRELGASYLTSAVAFYPYCGSAFHFYNPGIPLQIHIGAADNWTPATLCKDLARRWQLGNQYVEYPNAHHGFDRINTDQTIRGVGDAGTMAERTLRSDPASNQIARQHIRTFFNQTLRDQ
jgi:dienelactone hydrolase